MVDKKLGRERELYKELRAPEDMEERLRLVLEEIKPKPSSFKFSKALSLLVVILGILAVNSNSIGGYLRDNSFDEKIIGEYKNLMPSNLKKLKAEGIVQDISKELELGGRKILIDGLIVDSLGVNIFLRGDRSSFDSLSLVDRRTNKELYGSSIGLELDKGEVYSYYFKGNLKGDRISLNFNKGDLEKSVEIKVDENLRLSNLEKLDINKKIVYNKLNYRLENIYISPIAISIEGYNENILETGIRTILNRRKDYGGLDIDLILNGRRLSPSEAEFKTDYSGKRFNYLYRDIPDRIESLELEIIGEEGLIDRLRIK